MDFYLWYSISTLESHTYKRAKCCPYAGFIGIDIPLLYHNSYQKSEDIKSTLLKMEDSTVYLRPLLRPHI